MLQYNKKPLFCKQRLIFFLIGFWQKPHHHKLRTVAEPDIDGMSAEAAPHDHVLSVLFKLACTIRMEKLVLRSTPTIKKAAMPGLWDGHRETKKIWWWLFLWKRSVPEVNMRYRSQRGSLILITESKDSSCHLLKKMVSYNQS